MTVDAIVVSFNTRVLLRASLASLRASRYPIHRVFVVDNASVDGSAQMVAAEFPDVMLVEMSENLGFAQANNAAFEHCEADALLLLNSDAELSPDTLGELMTSLTADDRIGVVGPVLLGDDGLVQYEGGRRDPTILGEFGNISHLNTRLPHSVFGRYLMNEWDHRSTRDVDVLSGACMLIRTSALRGRLFCADFFMYGEDIELCQRLRADGWRMRYVGTAQVAHRGGAASQKARAKMRVAGVVSMAQLLRRTRGPLYSVGYAAIVPIAWPLGSVIRKAWPK